MCWAVDGAPAIAIVEARLLHVRPEPRAAISSPEVLHCGGFRSMIVGAQETGAAGELRLLCAAEHHDRRRGGEITTGTHIRNDCTGTANSRSRARPWRRSLLARPPLMTHASGIYT